MKEEKLLGWSLLVAGALILGKDTMDQNLGLNTETILGIAMVSIGFFIVR